MTAFDEAADRVGSGADARVEAAGLVALMTLEEKLGCLDGDVPFWPGLADLVSGGYNAHPWPAARVERLGIPGLDFADGPRGCVIGPATTFPVSMARGASFDPALEQRVADEGVAAVMSAYNSLNGDWCGDSRPRTPTSWWWSSAIPEPTRVNISGTPNSSCSWPSRPRWIIPNSAYERPQKRLMGFAKVRLDAGAEATVEVPVDRSLLDMRIDGGRLREDLPVEWSIGFDAASTRLI